MPSRYKGNDDECPHCGLKYRNLKTGLRYYDVFVMLMDCSPAQEDWTYKRRGTVLGKWFQIKQEMWDYHINEGGCEKDPRNVAAGMRPPLGQVIDALDCCMEACGEDTVPF